MSKVFHEAIDNGGVFLPGRLRLLRRIFDELCIEHKLSPAAQNRRDALAVALVETGQVTSDEHQLKAAGLRAITIA
jgi:hypothetical protein